MYKGWRVASRSRKLATRLGVADTTITRSMARREEVSRSPLLTTSEMCSAEGGPQIRISPSIVMPGLISGVSDGT